MQNLRQNLKTLFIVAIFFTMIFTNQASAEKHPLTVAESSNFTETSMYSDVIDFIRELQILSPFIKVENLCLSSEGREIPLLILGNPVPASSMDLIHDKRAVVYIQANIHAGEVEGKEAVLMLARDVLETKSPPYLNDLVILIAPIFNADGNEKISPDNRRNQVGPEKGVGVRYNGQNLDLNRDGMKQESPEIQGLVQKVLNRWDPVLLVDCHTTNGSLHKEPVTYVWQLNPNGDISLIKYMREKMMPTVDKLLEDKYNTLSIPYGNFMNFRNPDGWSPAGPQPRYITNYVGLRNRMAILNENYAYADYKTRVMGCYYFLHSTLEFCAENRTEIIQLLAKVDQKTIQRGIQPREDDQFILEYDVRPLDEPLSILGWEMEAEDTGRGYPRLKKTDVEKTYVLPFFCDFFAKRTIQFPYGYLITLSDPLIVKKLTQHGIVVEKLMKPVSLEVEAYQFQEIKGAERLYQGHRMNTVKGEYKTIELEFPEGTLFVGTAQKLANVGAYLLEAESDDGFVVWNFLDRYLISQWGRGLQTYPIYRLMEPANLVKQIIE